MNYVDGNVANTRESVSAPVVEELSPVKAAEKAAAAEKASRVRLIIQRPQDGALLLRRFETVDENGDDGYELPSYWSFVGLENFRQLKDEKSILDAVNRSAHRRLGIEIHNLSLIMPVFNEVVKPPLLQRAYLYTRDWSGELKEHCNPDAHQGSLPAPEQGARVWCLPQFLSTYLFHPEVVQAAKKAHELTGMFSYRKPNQDEVVSQQE